MQGTIYQTKSGKNIIITKKSELVNGKITAYQLDENYNVIQPLVKLLVSPENLKHIGFQD